MCMYRGNLVMKYCYWHERGIISVVMPSVATLVHESSAIVEGQGHNGEVLNRPGCRIRVTKSELGVVIAQSNTFFFISLLFILKLRTGQATHIIQSPLAISTVIWRKRKAWKSRRKKRRDKTVNTVLGQDGEGKGRRLQSWEMFSIFATGTGFEETHHIMCFV